jgi:hypothetical protein
MITFWVCASAQSPPKTAPNAPLFEGLRPANVGKCRIGATLSDWSNFCRVGATFVGLEQLFLANLDTSPVKMPDISAHTDEKSRQIGGFLVPAGLLHAQHVAAEVPNCPFT